MSTPYDTEMERRVADVLHHHMEIAMSRTDTEQQYEAFVADTSSAPRRRVAWAVSAVAAAAAVVVALVLTGILGPSPDRSERQVPARDRTPVQIATDFVDALAAYDATKAAHDLATSEDSLRIWPGEPSLRDGLAWAEAAGFKIMPKDCVREGRDEGSTLVSCSFDWHFLGSDRLGQPAYDGGYRVWVRDGRIVSAAVGTRPGWWLFGLIEDVGRWRPFASWLEREHPDDVAAMITIEDNGNGWPTYTDEALALWERYVNEWVASQT